MLESVNAVPAGPGEEESDRIDALLSSALADQARERRLLVETVFGAKTALVKAEEELAELREFITQRDESLLEAVTARMEEVVRANQPTQGDGELADRIEAIEEAILQLAQRIAELGDLPAQLRRDLEISAVAIGERVGEESATLLADLREDQVEVVQTLAAMSDGSLSEIKQSTHQLKQELLERLSAAARDGVESTRTTAEAMVEHLTGYLQQRDDTQYRARDQRLVELFQQLSETLGRSTKRKIGKAMEEQGPRPPLSPPPSIQTQPPPMPRTFRQPPREESPPKRDPFRLDSGAADFSDLRPAGRPARAETDPAQDEDLFGTDSPPTSSASGSMGNPLSRAEIARDFLIDPATVIYIDDLPAGPGDAPRRKTAAKPRSRSKPGAAPPAGAAAKPRPRRKPPPKP